MRLRRRPQGRIPIRLTTTDWLITVRNLRWEGDSLSGLHRWLIVVQPQPDDEVKIWRNYTLIYDGCWQGLAGDPTLW